MGRPNFYSAAIAIYQNSACLIVIINMLLIFTLLIGKGLQLLFFGQLRALELEHLYERAFYALTESFLVLTVFKDEFKMQFSVFFSILLFLRIFHWIISDRVDLIFQTAQPASWLTHARLGSAILIFSVLDLVLIRYCVTHILANATGTLVMFAFEFALLKNSMILSAGRYALNIYESVYLSMHADEDNWEQKSFCTFILEALCDSTRLFTYVLFFFVILKPYGLPPLHIVRDVYITTASLFSKVRDYLKARRAQAAMDKEILNATIEDLARDNVCIICREEMSIGGAPVATENNDHNPPRTSSHSQRYIPKKLSCSHVIHYGCLKSWLERSQRCPTCRRPVLTGETPTVTTVDILPPQPALPVQNIENNLPVAVADANNNNPGNGTPQDELQYFQPAVPPALPATFQPFNLNNIPIPATPTPTTTNTTMVGAGGSSMILQHHIEFPTGLQLPKGWGVLSSKETSGVRQVQLVHGQWAIVLPAPSSSSAVASPSSSRVDASRIEPEESSTSQEQI